MILGIWDQGQININASFRIQGYDVKDRQKDHFKELFTECKDSRGTIGHILMKAVEESKKIKENTKFLLMLRNVQGRQY